MLKKENRRDIDIMLTANETGYVRINYDTIIRIEEVHEAALHTYGVERVNRNGNTLKIRIPIDRMKY
jgi:hypothetical protein